MRDFVQLEINKRNRWVYFNSYRWVAHVLYWLWVFVAGTLMRVQLPLTASIIFNHFILDNLLIASFYYLYCLYLIPYYFKRNKNTLFWTLVLLSCILMPAIDVIYNRNFVHLTYTNIPQVPEPDFLKSYFSNLGNYIFNFLFFSVILFFMEKNEEGRTLLELENEKKEIEQVKLDLLKTNISPDFLMRSLAQLKQAAAENDPQTPEAILTFSDLLRYRLYTKRKQQTTLQEEIDALYSFIHFIELNKDKSNLHVDLQLQGNPENKNLAPLALINVLEPFCKASSNKPVTLQMILLIEEEEITLEMDYGLRANEVMLSDLEEYGNNYRQLYGASVKFHFENCEDNRCTINLTLPVTPV